MIWGLLWLALIFTIPEAAAKNKDFDFAGRIGAGFRGNYQGESKRRFEMRLQAESPRKDGVKGVVEMRGDEDTRTISVNDAFVDYRNDQKDRRVRFGRGKKILGWEWEYSTSVRLTINRSSPYDFLSERALTGRDYFLSYVWLTQKDSVVNEGEGEEVPTDLKALTNTSYVDPTKIIDPSQKWKYELSVHTNESDDIAIIGSVIRTFAPHWRLGGWVLAQRLRSVTEVMGVWATTASLLYQAGIHRVAVEWFAGHDPFRSELNRLYGGSRATYFTSVRGEYGAFVQKWNPYMSAAGLWNDVFIARDRLYEGILGVRYFFTPKMNVALEGMTRSSLSPRDPTQGSYSENGLQLLVRSFF